MSYISSSLLLGVHMPHSYSLAKCTQCAMFILLIASILGRTSPVLATCTVAEVGQSILMLLKASKCYFDWLYTAQEISSPIGMGLAMPAGY